MNIVRLRFPILTPAMIPVDHAEPLFAAVSRIVPIVHEADAEVAISSIRGNANFGSSIWIGEGGWFYIQSSIELVPELLKLAGRSLLIGNVKILIGIPQITPILPSNALISRFVTVRGKNTEDELSDYIQNWIKKNLISDLSENITYEVRILRRRIITLHGKKIYGFGVKIQNISDPELSVRIQCRPPGGRRRYGGSFFLPVSEENISQTGEMKVGTVFS